MEKLFANISGDKGAAEKSVIIDQKKGEKWKVARSNMKKFTFKGVLDGFRSTVQASARPEQEIQETLRSSDFTLKKVSFS